MTESGELTEWDKLQQQGLARLLERIDSGTKSIAAAAPTGYGKTNLAALLFRVANERGWPWAFYTHRKQLFEQTKARFDQFGLHFGCRAAGWHEYEALKQPGQLVMVQSDLSAVRSEKREHHKARLVLLDEAHAAKNANTAIHKLMKHHIAEGATVVGLTATPIGMAKLCDDIVILASNSDVRAVGGLLAAHTYAPSEFDMRKVRRVSSGEFDSAQMSRRVRIQAVVGSIYQHWMQLNPDAMPAIGFGPDIPACHWMVDQFLRRGVRTAHVDGEDVYLGEKDRLGDPVVHKSNRKMREEVARMSESGEIKIVWNRFVLREGVDWPWLYHAIMATSFGTIEGWLQSAGRLLRAHPSMDHCVARDTLVLTDKGEIPIQNVTLDHRVWDGIQFVSHAGAVCKGLQPVMTYDGLTATPDHEVLTSDGWITIQEAANRRLRIARSQTAGTNIRSPHHQQQENGQQALQPASDGDLCRVREDQHGSLSQHPQENSRELRALRETQTSQCAKMAVRPLSGAISAVHKSKHIPLPLLWGEGNRISVRESKCCRTLDCSESGNSQQTTDTRSDRQQWALRAGQPAMDDADHTVCEQPQTSRIACAPVQISASGSPLPLRNHMAIPEAGVLRAPDSPEMEGALCEVWDILNCGPNHCFTANGLICHNCVIQDHGGNCHRHHVSVNSDHDWRLDETDAAIRARITKQIKQGDRDEERRCPRCSRIMHESAWRAKDGKCPFCDFKFVRRQRVIIQEDGTLERVTDKSMKRKPPDSAAQKAWDAYFWPSRNSKSDRSNTFAQLKARFNRETPFKIVRADGRTAAQDQSGTIWPLRYVPPPDDPVWWHTRVKYVKFRHLQMSTQ